MMLDILAQSMMIATRTEIMVRDAARDDKQRRDRWFWQGRRWRAIDPNQL